MDTKEKIENELAIMNSERLIHETQMILSESKKLKGKARMDKVFEALTSGQNSFNTANYT